MATQSPALRAGFVGTGVQAGYLARAIRPVSDVEVVACVDINPATSEAFGREHGAKPYESIEAAASSGIDVWYVVSPPFAHEENVNTILDVSNQTVGIMCEKPFALTMDQANGMTARAQAKGAVLTCGLDRRYSAIQWLRRLVDEQTLGHIYRINIEWLMFNATPNRGVFLNKELSGGGSGMDILWHPLDWALYLAGYDKLSSIQAWTHGLAGSVEETIHGTVEVGDDQSHPTVVDFHTSWNAPVPQHRMSLEAFADRGRAKLELKQQPSDLHYYVPSVTLVAGGGMITDDSYSGLAFPELAECRALALQDVARAVRARRDGDLGAHTLVTPSQATALLRTVLGAYASAEAHHPVSLR